jgi:hypothetical protein
VGGGAANLKSDFGGNFSDGFRFECRVDIF